MRTEGFPIILAVGLHAGLLMVGRWMRPLSLLRPEDNIQLRVIDVELNTERPAELHVPTPPPEAAPEPGAIGRPEDRPVDPRRLARASVAPGGPSPSSTVEPGSPEGNPEPAPPGRQRPTQFDELPADEGPGGLHGPAGLGLGRIMGPDMIPESGPPKPAPTVAPAPRQVDRDIAGKVITQALTQRDKEIGIELPVAGAIRTAMRTAAQGSEIPTGTRGSITCQVSPTGVVSNCRLRSSTGGGSEAWNVIARAGASVAGTALPGQYAHGAVVTIDINIVSAPPAGSKGGLSGIGAAFDVSNIGAHATRQVKTSQTVTALP